MAERPSVFIHSIFGLSPRKRKFDALQLLDSAVHLIILITLFTLIKCFQEEKNGYVGERLGGVAFSIQLNAMLFTSVVLIILGIFNSKRISEQFETLEGVDKTLNPPDLRFKWWFTLIQFFLAAILIFFDLFVCFYLQASFSTFATFWIMFHFICTSKIVIHDYKIFSSNIAHRLEFNTQKLKETDNPVEKISLYSILTNVATSSSYIIGLEISLILFFNSCFSIYYIYKIIQNAREMFNHFEIYFTPIGIVVNLIYVLSWYYDIWSVVHSTEKITDRANQFNSSLLKKVIESGEPTLIDNEKIQLHVAVKKAPKITAYGFCYIDYTFLYNLAALTTTYLVILTQFNAL